MSFLRLYIHVSSSSWVFSYSFINIVFLKSLFIYTHVSFEYLRGLVIVFFCSIGLYVRYPCKQHFFSKFCFLCDLLGAYYLSVKNWPCSLCEILVNLEIYVWVWPDFWRGNCSKLLVNFLRWNKLRDFVKSSSMYVVW